MKQFYRKMTTRRFMTSRKNGDENTVVLFRQNIFPGYETNILSFSSDLNQTSLFDPSNFGITSDNFELLWSNTGEVPTIEVINKSIGIAIKMGFTNTTSQGFLYRFKLNDINIYFKFSSMDPPIELLKEIGINMLGSGTPWLIIDPI